MPSSRRRVTRKARRAQKELAREIREIYGFNRRNARKIAANTLARNS